MVVELVEKPKIRSTNGSFKKPFMNENLLIVTENFWRPTKMIKFLKKHQKSASLLWKPPQLLWTQKNLRIGQTKIL